MSHINHTEFITPSTSLVGLVEVAEGLRVVLEELWVEAPCDLGGVCAHRRRRRLDGADHALGQVRHLGSCIVDLIQILGLMLSCAGGGHLTYPSQGFADSAATC